MCARTHFEIFDKNLILHSKFQKKSMLMTQYRLLSHRKWLSIRYWGMLRNALLWGPWSLKFRHLLNRWPWPNIVGCHYCCGPTKPPILDLFAITQHSILSHNKLLSIEYWVLKDTESLYFTISTLCIGAWYFLIDIGHPVTGSDNITCACERADTVHKAQFLELLQSWKCKGALDPK